MPTPRFWFSEIDIAWKYDNIKEKNMTFRPNSVIAKQNALSFSIGPGGLPIQGERTG
jgi:hypothetical protein